MVGHHCSGAIPKYGIEPDTAVIYDKYGVAVMEKPSMTRPIRGIEFDLRIGTIQVLSIQHGPIGFQS